MQIRKSLERGMAAWNLTRHGISRVMACACAFWMRARSSRALGGSKPRGSDYYPHT